MSNLRASLRSQLNATSSPRKITQEPFDRDPSHLRRLVNLKDDELPNGQDPLWYMEDLRYTKIQTDLFLYLLPVLLEMWRDDLRGTFGFAGVIEQFYPVLADCHIFDQQLNPKQTAVVSEFMRNTILEEIDEQRGLAHNGSRARPYRWIRALTTCGVLLSDLYLLWSIWWSVNTVGRAVGAIQYASCLMYGEYENPIFSLWTPNGGGGPPVLWDFEGHLYNHRWLEPNVRFLSEALTPAAVENLLARATERLSGEAEHDIAEAVLSDFPVCLPRLTTRCAQLPEILTRTDQPIHWPEN